MLRSIRSSEQHDASCIWPTMLDFLLMFCADPRSMGTVVELWAVKVCRIVTLRKRTKTRMTSIEPLRLRYVAEKKKMQKQCCNVVIMMKFDEWAKKQYFWLFLLLLCLGISSSTAWHFPSKPRTPKKIKIEGHTSLFLHPDAENPSYAHLCCTISCCFTIFNC